ncbi:MAG: hypothetical protein GXX08_08375 [Firmicutes bacterium]|nr:hypothetical protein [Bacillota bacterium]
MMRSARYLMQKYGRFIEFSVPGPGGTYNNRGRYVKLDGTQLKARAIIAHLTSEDLRLYEAGTYTSNDLKVITSGHVGLPIGTTFVWKGSEYEIQEVTDNSHIADAQVHVAVKVVTKNDPA